MRVLVLRSQHATSAGRKDRITVLVCGGGGFRGPESAIQQIIDFQGLWYGSGDPKLPATNREGGVSAGVMMQRSSVASWSHLEHVHYSPMPRDHASDIA